MEQVVFGRGPALLLLSLAPVPLAVSCTSADDGSSAETQSERVDPSAPQPDDVPRSSMAGANTGDSERADDPTAAGGTSSLGGTGGDGDASATERGAPVFVAVGWGGRRLSSCDGGRTWQGDQQVAPESEDDWHRSYTPKGLMAGGGAFVFLTGWGTDSTAFVTRDGMSWSEQLLETSYGGGGYVNDRFLLIGNRELAESTDGGLSWQSLDDDHPAQDRETMAFDEVLVAGADGAVSTRLGDGDWSTLASCAEGAHHVGIGSSGGFAVGNGRLISIDHNGHICALELASGDDLGAGSLGVALEGKPKFLRGQFWAVTGDTIHRSDDGFSWQTTPLPANVRFDLVEESDEGTLVGVSSDGDRFYSSDDGNVWTPGAGPEGNGLIRLAFGRLPGACE